MNKKLERSSAKDIRNIVFSIFLSVIVIASLQSAYASNGNADVNPPMGPPEGWTAHPPHHIIRSALASPAGGAFYPAQIQAAYNLPSTGGSGTIAIIDAYDDPYIENDLNVFSTQYGLPPCTSANGCFQKYMMSSSIANNSLWANEMALDTEWAHGIAPNANILMVEANSNSWSDLLSAIDYATSRPDVVAISMSFDSGEWGGETGLDYHFTSPSGAAFFAASGDSGTGATYPASSPNVVGVGGTQLSLWSNGSVYSETAWSGSGGGLSLYEPEPSYQVSYNVPGANSMRAVPDVSAVANSLSVYSSYLSGWGVIGGTSASTPIWAAIQSLGLSASNNNFYQDANSANYPSYFRDIISGSNGNCGFYCNAMTGYDYVTGLGSPITTSFNPTSTPTPTSTPAPTPTPTPTATPTPTPTPTPTATPTPTPNPVTVAISSPSSGTILNTSTVSVSGTANDTVSGIQSVQVSVDGGAYTLATGTTTWSFTASSLSGGSHTITAKAIDNYGNTATTSINITVDTTPPTVVISSPSNDAILNTSTVSVSGTANDTVSGVQSVQVSVDGGAYTLATGTTTWSFTASSLSGGSHTITAKAIDNYGNTATTSINITVDTTPPTVSITSPLNGAFVSRKSTVTIAVSASDNIGVVLVNFYVNGGLQCSGTGNTCNWNVPAKPGATYSLQAIAYDAAGNAGSSSLITVTSQ